MFYKKGVDITSAKSMFNFINEHYTYHTLNSWNGLRSIANNVKLYNLDLDDMNKAWSLIFDESDESGLQFNIMQLIKDWEEENPYYSLGFNGRSGGYLVMYNKEHDGRINFRNILPEDLRGYDNYEDWKQSIRDSYYHERVKDYIPQLREYTKLIQSFDKLCDDIVDMINYYC